ncbi:phosphate transport system permease protein PstA [Tepiditoga spiralis]|uniref:Phosphate transport system permease protein PstA n=1 Tax=Tepiditoga spiralis TaxID=2108365 RepID=A0A7G1GC13_9BACT|nr:phosphate ABC transporter permease PstA [Tepiditoga spiralis]BBE31589.1 phosphate transport system permease protein PstA [Tepiditoga spiralis]
MKKDLIISIIFRVISYFVFSVILSLFTVIIFSGIKNFSLDFFFQFPKDMMTAGGIFPAILGSFLLLILTLIISIPIGILTGIFLSEYGNNILGSFLDISITSLSGVPSIVFGLFGLSFFSIGLNLKTSIISGSLTLAVMTLPIIASTVKEAISSVPNFLRESSMALGAKKTETIFKVIVPAAKTRITTSVLIGSGKIIGETAPILLTGAVFYSTRLPHSLKEPVMTLTTHIYNISMAYGENAQWMAKSTASFLMLFILLIYGIAFNLRRKMNGKHNNF